LGKRAEKDEAFMAPRFEAGSHGAPGEGVCVVEFASLLAGERFSDRPECVCEVIAAFLRAWNDRSAYADRQRLAPYAVHILNTRASRKVTTMRRDMCLVWAGTSLEGGVLRRLVARLGARLRILVLLGVRPALRLDEGAGELAARVVFARYDEEVAFLLLDGLLALGEEGGDAGSESAPLATAIAGPAQERVAAAVRELARHAQVPGGEQRRNGSNGNGHAGHVSRRDAGQGDEEQVQHNGSSGDDPERDPKVPERAHVGQS
jgi:hypothetical protein